jgi:glycerol-3-phosphate dehydrogenase (NAD(P)+)
LAERLGPGSREILCALSGPNFAEEIIRGLPAGTVVACENEACARRVQDILSSPVLRVYTSDDLIGVELGGALKNVYAIAVGIVESLGLGVNVQATLITRGLAELARLGVRLGAHPFTFAGLSGLGDIVLTCTSDLSRNRRAGLALGRGQSLEEISAAGETVEGIRAARAVRELARQCEVEMPIAEQLCQILFEGKDPMAAVEELMERAARTEREEEFVTESGILGKYRP